MKRKDSSKVELIQHSTCTWGSLLS